ncbi:hypothetical protein D082_50200 (plasmid) [Synechocystis sp. PCC 6714]|nr:hypothetical protein D082_50200 [Synechocystis sp. PCC 6714]
MPNLLFEALASEIDETYAKLGHSLGWRFLTSPKRTLSKETDYIFLTINPAGNKITHADSRESCENGSPYLYERWKNSAPGKSPLQVQIQLLFMELEWEFDSVLSGQLVPFRSPSWNDLPHQKQSLNFGISIWARIIAHVQPKMIVAVGKTQLREPICKMLGSPILSSEELVGWGSISAGLDIFDSCSLVTLPHLSRFQIMGRDKSKEPIRKLIQTARAKGNVSRL